MLEYIERSYDDKPMIVIYDEEQLTDLQQLLQSKKYRHRLGASEDNLQEIKSWDYGLLLLQPNECRGTDTRFAKDAVVLIVAKVESYSLYL